MLLSSVSTRYFMMMVAIGFIVLFIGILVQRAMNRGKIKKLSDSAIEMTPQEFLALRTSTKGNSRYGKGVMKQMDFPGVYIIFNQTKKMYYVGQSVNVFERVTKHFTGKGNGDVYADYKYGDTFVIRFVQLKNSGFQTLNALEKQTIDTYNAFSKGYNKTRGNRG